MSTNEQNPTEFRKVLGSLERKVERAKDAIKRLEKLSSKLDVSAFEAMDLLAELRQLKESIESESRALQGLGPWIEQYEVAAKDAKNRMRERLGHGISEGLKPLGVPVQGRFPELSAGPIFMDFKPEQGKVEICLGKGGPVLEKQSIDVAKIVQSVTEQHATLFSGDFDAAHFIGLVHKAIVRANRIAERATDAPVPMSELLLELNVVAQNPGFAADPKRNSFKAYTRLMTAVHFFRARPLQGDGFELRLVVATREQTRKKTDHLYVPTDMRGHGTHFSAVQLKRRSM